MPNAIANVQHIAFLGLHLEYSDHVLTPRLETESLVLGIARRVSNPDIVIDIGTGSGAIILSLASRYPKAMLEAVDISTKALEVAQKNAKAYTIVVDFQIGNLLSRYLVPQKLNTLIGQDVLIVANLPYIGVNEAIGDDVHLHDPHIALFGGGDDGFDLISELLVQSMRLSKHCAHLRVALEFGHLQLPLVSKWCEENGVTPESWCDYSNIFRFALIDYGHS